MSDANFEISALGRPGDEHPYEVTEDALRAYAEATDDVPGGPVFACVPVFRGDRSRLAGGRLGGRPRARRPLRAGHPPAPAARGRDDAPLARDAGGAPRSPQRDLARHPHGDEERGRRARERAVRDRVLPRRRGSRERRRPPPRPPSRGRRSTARGGLVHARGGSAGPLRSRVGRRLRDPPRRRVRALGRASGADRAWALHDGLHRPGRARGGGGRRSARGAEAGGALLRAAVPG